MKKEFYRKFVNNIRTLSLVVLLPVLIVCFPSDISARCPTGISVSPGTTQTLCLNGTANSLTATTTISSGGPTTNMTYQWYYNTTNSNTVAGATAVGAATNTTTNTPTNILAAGNISTATPGTRWYFCQVVSTSGCSGVSFVTSTVQVTVSFIPTITFAETSGTVNNDGIICNGALVTLTATPTSGHTYSWAAPISASGNDKVVSPSSTTSYTVTVTNSSTSCSATASASVTVNSISPTITFTETSGTTSNDGTICAGTSVTLTANPASGATYAWASPISASGNDKVVSPGSTTSYTVTVTNSSTNCSASTSASVTVNSLPTPTITYSETSGATNDDGIICSGQPVTLVANPTSGMSYSWAAPISASGNNKSVSPTSTTSYTVTVTNTTTNCAASVSASVTVDALPSPSIAFTETSGTANDDGIICNGTSATLTATPSSGVTYAWSGPGGTTDNISVSPTSTTSYTVTVTSTANCSASASSSVTVNALPAATISFAETSGAANNDGVICNGATVTLTANPISGMTYSWGSPISASGNDKAVSPSTTTPYTVTVSNSSTNCVASASASVTVNTLPNPSIAFSEFSGSAEDDGVICAGMDVTLIANPTSGMSYSWAAPISATGNNKTVTPSSTTSYTVTVTNANGCSASTSSSVTVNALPNPVISFTETSGTANNDGIVCAGASVTLTTTPVSGVMYGWSTGGSADNISVSSSSTTAYSVTVTNTTTSCFNSASATVTVNVLPGPTITFAETSGTSNNDGIICEGTSVTLTANPTSGMIYSWAAPISASGNDKVVSPASSTSYDVTVTNSTTACSASASTSVIVNTLPSPTISFTETSGSTNDDGTICSGDAVTLVANPTSGMSYSWAAPISATGNSKSVSPASTTSYTVTVTNSSTACFASVSASVTVNSVVPAIAFTETSGTVSNDGIVCNTDAVTLTVTPASDVTYSWSTGGTADNISVTPSSTTSYSVTVTNPTTNCSASVSASVTVNSLPSPTISFTETSGTANDDGVICEGTSVTLTANPTSGMAYSWAAPISAGGNSKVVSPASTTSYAVTVTNSTTSCSATASTSVTVNTLPTPTISFTETSGSTNDDGNICSGDAVTLTANPTSGMDYSWAAPISATGNNKLVSPASTTSYTVTVTNPSTNCASSTSAAVTIDAVASSAISFSETSGTTNNDGIICNGDAVTLTATPSSGVTYLWSTTGTSDNINVSPSSTSAYSVTVTNAISGCSASASVSVTVNTLPGATITFAETSGTTNNDGIICNGTSATLTASPTTGMTYAWAAPISATGNDKVVSPTSTTSYTVTVTNSATACAASASASVTVNSLPSPAISFSETSGTTNDDGIICNGASVTLTATPSSGVTYSWSSPGGTSDNISVSPSSTTAYSVTVTSSTTACSAFASTSVIVNTLPSATVSMTETSGTANDDGIICNGASVTLTANPTSGMNYSWASPISATGNDKVVSPALTTSYDVTVTNSTTACSAAASASVTVNSLPSPTVTFTETSGTTNDDGITCSGAAVTLTANPTSGMDYSWAAPISATGNNKSVSPTSTTTYTVTVTNSFTNCAASVSALVTVNTLPSPAISFTEISGTTNNDGVICNGVSVTLTATPSSGVTYSWSSPGGTSDNISVSPSSTTSYSVTVTNSTTSCSASASTSVTVNTLPSPTVSFTETSGTANDDGIICTGTSVTLTANPTSGMSYSWAAPISASGNNKVVSPASTTSYDVTVTNSTTACSASASTSVTVNSLPSPTITFAETSGTTDDDGIICSGATVTLTANPASGMNYSWAAPISATGNNKSVSPASTTSYTVTVTNSSTNCAAPVSASVTVNSLPSPTISFAETSGTTNDDGTICNSDAVTLTANPTSGMTYSWAAPISATENDKPVSPASTTAYTVTVTSTSTNCAASVSASVTVNSLPSPTISYTETSGTTNDDGTICNGTSVTLTANPTSGMNYSWAAPISATGNNKPVFPASTTSYTVTVTNSTTACSASASTSVTVNSLPSPTISFTETSGTTNDDGIICSGDAVTLIANPTTGMNYSWAAPISAAGNNKSVSPASTTAYTVTVTNSSTNCAASVSASVTVNSVSPTITFAETSGSANNDGTICTGDAVTLTANPTSGMTYSWAAPISATGNDKSVSPASTTSYAVTVTSSSSNCSSSVSASVTVNTLPSPTITFAETSGTTNSDGIICSGASVTLTTNPTSGMNYNWAAPISATGNNKSVSPTSTTSYTVTVTNSTTACSATTSASVTVNPLPGDNAGADVSICNGANTTIGATATGGNTYSWTPTTALSSSTVANPTAAPTSTTTYTLTETIIATGCSSSNSVVVTVNPVPLATATNSAQTICSGVAFTTMALSTSNSVSGTTFVWTRNNTTEVTGISASGSGTNITGVALTNTTNAPVTVTFTITPTGPAPTFCLGPAITATVTVNPTPAGSASPQAICSGATTSISLSSTVSGTSFTWTASVFSGSVSGASNCLSSCGVSIAQTLTSATGGVERYTVTPTANTCAGSTFTVDVTVNAFPVGTTPTAPYSVCSGTSANISIVNSQTGVNYQLRNNLGNTNIGSPVAGTGGTINLPSGTLTNATTFNVLATNPSTSCSVQMPATVTVEVTPLPSVSVTPSPATICLNGNSVLTATNSGGIVNQTFSGSGSPNIAIADNTNAGYTYPTITLSGSGGGTVSASNIIQVTLNLTHGRTQDMDIYVVDPSGTRAMLLSSDNGGNGDNYTNTVFRTDASTVITSGLAPFTGTFRPEGTITTAPDRTDAAGGATYNAVVPANSLNGAPIDGAWSLRVFDDASNMTGTVVSWSLDVIIPSNYTTTVTGPATIGSVSYSGTANSTATATVTPPVGSNLYTITTTDGMGCSVQTTSTITVNPLPAATISNTETSGVANDDGIICNGASVTLIANPTSGMTYSWAAPISATGNNKSVSPTSTTSYTVTVTNSTTSCSATATASITVNAIPATISITETSGTANDGVICNTASVTLTANPTTGVTYAWASPPGGTTNGQVVTPSSNTTYTLTVTNSTIACSASASATVSVNALPAASVSVAETSGVTNNDGIICSGASVTLTANPTTGMNYSWAAPISATGNTKVVSPTSNTTYTVTVTNQTTGCSITASSTITVNTLPTPTITRTETSGTTVNDGTICSGDAVTLTANPTTGMSYSWAAPISATGNDKVVSPAATTTYTVSVTNSSTGCLAVTSTPVTVNTLPAANVSVTETSGSTNNDGNICTGASATLTANPTTGMSYLWAAPISAGGNGKVVTPASTTAYNVTITNSTTACSATATRTITVNPVPTPTVSVAETSGTANNDGVICSGASVTLTANPTSGMNYSWAAPISATGNNKVVSPTSNTTYTVTVTSTSAGCSATANTSITVTSLPSASISVADTSGVADNDGLICVGNSATLTASPATGLTYAWSSPPGGTGNSITVEPDNNTTYSVTVTDPATACARVLSRAITVYPDFFTDAWLSGNIGMGVGVEGGQFCDGDNLNFHCTVGGNSTYDFLWTGPGNWSGIDRNQNRQQIDSFVTGMFYVVATDVYTGCIGRDSMYIVVHDTIPLPAVPTSNSPQCADVGVTISYIGTPPSGVEWYWQTSATGISFSDSLTSYTVFTSGTYYLRAYNYTYNCWSEAQPITVVVYPLPAASITATEASGTTNDDGVICIGISVTLTANPTTGMNYSWAAPISASGNNKSVTPASTTVYDVSVTNSTTGCSATATRTLTVHPVPSSTAVLADCMFIDSADINTTVDTNIVIVTGIGGTPPYTYIKPVHSEFRFLINAAQSAFTARALDQTLTFGVNDVNMCPSTSTVATNDGNPTTVPYTSTSGYESLSCYGRNFKKWLTFRDSSNMAVLSIHDDSLDLGIVTVSVYKDAADPVIPVTGGLADCQGYNATAMKRHFVVHSTAAQPFSKDVKVRLYFTDDELEGLKAASAANNLNVNWVHCSNMDDVTTINDLYVTKYSDPFSGSPTADGDYNNNLPEASGGIYKVYGDASIYPTQPNGPLSKRPSGFSSVYSNAQQGHHYVQLSVREFSEFWLHGSQNGTPLPVEMLYLEADVINNQSIRLRWATALEVNNSGFQVERSTDGHTWMPIAWVDGHNNTTTETEYSHVDVNVAVNIRYYYRLKQIDYDGQFEYTDMVTAIIHGENLMIVKDFVPNPATDRTTLMITATTEQNITVDIYNIIGQKVWNSSHDINRGANQLEFDTRKFASGTYTAVVTAASTFTKKLVVTK